MASRQSVATPGGDWTRQCSMSDPARYRLLFDDLPHELGDLLSAIQGFLIHLDWLRLYHADVDDIGQMPRTTLNVGQRLQDVIRRDPRPLRERRPPSDRSPGTCRDYALMLVSILRCRGVPARVRCGFGRYFGDGWEDHWICEYFDSARGDWRLVDAQLDDVQRRSLGIGFDTSDVPRSQFMPAGEAWTRMRAGEFLSDQFGHGTSRGDWFMAVNVVRDHLSLNNHVTSPWDTWRDAAPGERVLQRGRMSWLDHLAANPQADAGQIAPDWCRS